MGVGLSFIEAYSVVEVYYISIEPKTKERIIANFATSNSLYRIILIIEAIGIGVEIVDVRNVV